MSFIITRRNVSFSVSSGQTDDFFKACERAATRLSFTRMQDYKSCPLKFRYKYLEKKFTPMNEHAVRGSALHEAIAVFGRWYINRDMDNPQNYEPPSPHADNKDVLFPQEILLKLKEGDIQRLNERQMKVLMFRVYKEVWRRSMATINYKGSKEQLKAFYEQGKKMLWTFFIRETTMMNKASGDVTHDDEIFSSEDAIEFDEVYGFNSPDLQQRDATTPIVDTTIRRPHMVEQRFSFDVESPNRTIKVTGIFDRIDKAFSKDMGLHNHIIVVEYKTAIREYAKENHKDQVKLYTYAYQRVHGVRPSRGMVYSISDDNYFVYEPRKRDAGDVERIVLRISDSIANGYFRPKPDFNKCKFCDFRNICPSSAYQRNPDLAAKIDDYVDLNEETGEVVDELSIATRKPLLQKGAISDDLQEKTSSPPLSRGSTLPLLKKTAPLSVVARQVAASKSNTRSQIELDESDLEEDDDNPMALKTATTVNLSGVRPDQKHKSNTLPLIDRKAHAALAAEMDEDDMTDDDDGDSILLPQKKMATQRAPVKTTPKMEEDSDWEDSDEEL
eukprot:CAMPEP_0117447536 /NCGR_PEP_ID=MMETSP0759-20121206/6928_1 /TAXON_ID=63605 /ORGANISM="Percolomonas cosmopolitus, Strain WS" /LENGTH=557 /DNA_ID=CAMNT_0005239879 /DNA_START=208 /DNA_END=1881 /DNA_ORIENTATION=+